jgi:PAS domain S-box-containing protein
VKEAPPPPANRASRILQALGDPVVAVDLSGSVIVWTPAAEQLLGYAAQEVLNKGLPDLGIRLDMLLAGRERRLTLRTRDGDMVPATVTLTHLVSAEGELRGVVLLVKDLTPWIGPLGDEAADGDGLLVEERLGEAFRGIVEATGSETEPGSRLEPLAQVLADQGRRLLPEISCLIATIPPGRQDVFYCLAGSGPFAEGLVTRTFDRRGTVMDLALAEGRAYESTDMQHSAANPELFREGGVQTMRTVPMGTRRPLPDGRRALGAIAFFRPEPRPFAPAERRLLDDFGALVSLQLQRAELHASTERSMQRLEMAVDVALDLARSLDVREVVARLVRRAAVATNADRCALLRLEGGEDGEVVVQDAYDVNGGGRGVGHRYPLAAQPLLREAVASRAPVVAGPHDGAPMPPGLREAVGGVLQTCTMPLVYAGEVIAVLVLSRRRDVPFGQDDEDTLMLLGGPAALALRNSYLYQRTEEASRVKTDFLDMAAHELRTPLTVISGYLSIVREGAFGPPPDGWQASLRTLDAKAAELRRLVDDLLLAARLETGRLDTTLQAMDLREIAAQSAQAAEQAVQAGPGELFQLDLPPRPVPVRGDREQLSRLVDHLVNNALSYGREGERPWARIAVEVWPEASQARVVVEDQGRGLPAGAEDRIFERFSRLEDSDHPMVPGTGLGLYIARELAERHGGHVDLEWSQPGVGSRFALQVPLLRPEPAPAAAPAAVPVTAGAAPAGSGASPSGAPGAG